MPPIRRAPTSPRSSIPRPSEPHTAPLRRQIFKQLSQWLKQANAKISLPRLPSQLGKRFELLRQFPVKANFERLSEGQTLALLSRPWAGAWQSPLTGIPPAQPGAQLGRRSAAGSPPVLATGAVQGDLGQRLCHARAGLWRVADPCRWHHLQAPEHHIQRGEAPTSVFTEVCTGSLGDGLQAHRHGWGLKATNGLLHCIPVCF